MPISIDKLMESVNYTFQNRFILEKALTHRSFAVENNLSYDNQRLEFLGDAVIEIILTEYLFIRYQNHNEGELTKMRSVLAQQESLAKFARRLGLGVFLRLGKGEFESGGANRDSTLSDAFESLIGAIYMDGGLRSAKAVLFPLIEAEERDPDEMVIDLNPKGVLQEFTQKHMGVAPSYTLESATGPDHAPSYVISVFVNGKHLAQGEAGRRKVAEGIAAKSALKILMERMRAEQAGVLQSDGLPDSGEEFQRQGEFESSLVPESTEPSDSDENGGLSGRLDGGNDGGCCGE